MSKLHYRESVSEKEKRRFSGYLSEDEELILATGFSQAYLRSIFVMSFMWPGFLFLFGILGFFYWAKMDLMVGFGIGCFVTTLIGLAKTFLTFHANRYLLTTRRVIIKKGFFAVKLTAALYDKITHIEVDQSFFDKILMHHGTIIVNTAGMNKEEITLKFVDYPIELKNLLERMINREREQFGLRSGPVVTLEGEIV